jgi:hypothetical protein
MGINYAGSIMRTTLDNWDEKDDVSRIGQMTLAELMGIGILANALMANAYVTIGCGAGADILAITINYKELPTLAFDRVPISQESTHSGVEFHNIDLFVKEVIHPPKQYKVDLSNPFRPMIHDIIYDFTSRFPSPILYYTDNGKKLNELHELLKYLRRGDVIGTHDFTTEVPEEECQFILDAGCSVLSSYESWVKDHHCLQRFWIKG